MFRAFQLAASRPAWYRVVVLSPLINFAETNQILQLRTDAQSPLEIVHILLLNQASRTTELEFIRGNVQRSNPSVSLHLKKKYMPHN